MVNFLADAGYLWLRTARSYLRQPVWIVIALVQPVIWLTLYGQLFRRIVEIPGFGASSYIQFLTPGVVAMTALFNSVWAGFDLLEDMDKGILDRFLSTPLAPGSIILASVGYSCAAITVQTVIILGLGSLLGAHSGSGVLLVIIPCVLLAAALASFSNGMALLVRRREPLIAAINFLSLPLTFLSAAIMPGKLMPPWMLVAAQYNPVNWTVAVARAAFSPSVPWPAVEGDLGKLLVFALAFYFFAQWAFTRHRRRA